MAQNQAMTDKKSARILVRRPSIRAADRGDDSVRADPAEGAELELVSTQMLMQILASSDKEDRKAVKDVASGGVEGVLARDLTTGYFEILDDDELQAILDENKQLPKLSRPSDVTLEPLHDYADSEHLSLVSTQVLRQVLGSEDEKDQAPAIGVDVRCFNPNKND